MGTPSLSRGFDAIARYITAPSPGFLISRDVPGRKRATKVQRRGLKVLVRATDFSRTHARGMHAALGDL